MFWLRTCMRSTKLLHEIIGEGNWRALRESRARSAEEECKYCDSRVGIPRVGQHAGRQELGAQADQPVLAMSTERQVCATSMRATAPRGRAESARRSVQARMSLLAITEARQRSDNDSTCLWSSDGRTSECGLHSTKRPRAKARPRSKGGLAQEQETVTDEKNDNEDNIR